MSRNDPNTRPFSTQLPQLQWIRHSTNSVWPRMGNVVCMDERPKKNGIFKGGREKGIFKGGICADERKKEVDPTSEKMKQNVRDMRKALQDALIMQTSDKTDPLMPRHNYSRDNTAEQADLMGITADVENFRSERSTFQHREQVEQGQFREAKKYSRKVQQPEGIDNVPIFRGDDSGQSGSKVGVIRESPRTKKIAKIKRKKERDVYVGI